MYWWLSSCTIYINAIYSWPLNNRGLEAPNLAHQKLNYSCPLVFKGIGSRIPCRYQDPYIKWHWAMHTVSPLHPQIPRCKSEILFLIRGWLNLWMWNPEIWRADCIFIEKKTYKWTHTIQTVWFKGELCKSQRIFCL